MRVVVAMVLVLAAKIMRPLTHAIRLQGGDRPDGAGPSGTCRRPRAGALVLAYVAARFGDDLLRQSAQRGLRAWSGRTAARRLAVEVFAPSSMRLSLRFHLERRTGALTRDRSSAAPRASTRCSISCSSTSVPTVFELAARLRPLLRQVSAPASWSATGGDGR
jgi:hypothetical protein